MKIIMCVFGDSSLSIGNNYLPKKSGGKILKKCAQRATTVVNILKLSHSFTLFSFFLSLFSSLLFSSLLFSSLLFVVQISSLSSLLLHHPILAERFPL